MKISRCFPQRLLSTPAVAKKKESNAHMTRRSGDRHSFLSHSRLFSGRGSSDAVDTVVKQGYTVSLSFDHSDRPRRGQSFWLRVYSILTRSPAAGAGEFDKKGTGAPHNAKCMKCVCRTIACVPEGMHFLFSPHDLVLYSRLKWLPLAVYACSGMTGTRS